MKRISNFLIINLLLAFLVLGFSGTMLAKDLSTKDVEQVVEEIANVSKLSFKTIPTVKIVKTDDLSDIAMKEESYVHATTKKKEVVSILKLFNMTGQLGKYNFQDGKIYLNKELISKCADSTGLSQVMVQKIVTSQLMVIALDDQIFNLKNVLARSKEALATYALIQGHAHFLANQVYKRLGIDAKNLNEFNDYAKVMFFPVADKGMDFLTYVFKNSALTMKDLYAKLPVGDSIMEPQRYLAGNNQVTQIFPDSLASEMQKGLPWKFKFSQANPIDKLSMFFITKFFSPKAETALGYEGGISLAYSLSDKAPASSSMLQGFSMPIGQAGTLSIAVCKFSKPKDAEAYYKSISVFLMSGMMGGMQMGGSKDTDLKKSRDKYPNAFILGKKLPGNSDVVVYLAQIETNYIVEITGMNLKMTDDNLLQLVDAISKRL